MAYKAPRASFPYRMVETLKAMRPSDRFELTVEGGRDMTAEAMLPILQRELAAHHYDLVLWQTGTVEAVHGLRPERLREVLQDGADALANAQADLVLVDPQFSRFMRANVDVSPYETVLQQMAGNPDVTLFRRFDLTQLWSRQRPGRSGAGQPRPAGRNDRAVEHLPGRGACPICAGGRRPALIPRGAVRRSRPPRSGQRTGCLASSGGRKRGDQWTITQPSPG